MRSVGCGSDAKLAVGAVQPDLILLDLMLPDADGLVLTPALHRISGASLSPRSAGRSRVIVCSG